MQKLKSELKLKTELQPILSKREIQVVIKRLSNKHLTQTESNYMSRSIRPKLRAARYAANSGILSLLEYRKKKYEREDSILRSEIINAVKKHTTGIKAIIIFGSYVRNCHSNYRDIDILVALNKALWEKLWQKNALKEKIEKCCSLPIDVQLMEYSTLKRLFPYSPLLQTEMDDHKVIYGSISLKDDIIINKRDLFIELLEADTIIELGNRIDPRYIYNAIRMCLSIELFLDKKVSNRLILDKIEMDIGKATMESLMNNAADKLQKDIALRYLKHLYKSLEKVLR